MQASSRSGFFPLQRESMSDSTWRLLLGSSTGVARWDERISRLLLDETPKMVCDTGRASRACKDSGPVGGGWGRGHQSRNPLHPFGTRMAASGGPPRGLLI